MKCKKKILGLFSHVQFWGCNIFSHLVLIQSNQFPRGIRIYKIRVFNETFFLLETIAMITEKMSFSCFIVCFPTFVRAYFSFQRKRQRCSKRASHLRIPSWLDSLNRWEFKVLEKMGLNRLPSCTLFLWYATLFTFLISCQRFLRISANGRKRNLGNF